MWVQIYAFTMELPCQRVVPGIYTPDRDRNYHSSLKSVEVLTILPERTGRGTPCHKGKVEYWATGTRMNGTIDWTDPQEYHPSWVGVCSGCEYR